MNDIINQISLILTCQGFGRKISITFLRNNGHVKPGVALTIFLSSKNIYFSILFIYELDQACQTQTTFGPKKQQEQLKRLQEF